MSELLSPILASLGGILLITAASYPLWRLFHPKESRKDESFLNAKEQELAAAFSTGVLLKRKVKFRMGKEKFVYDLFLIGHYAFLLDSAPAVPEKAFLNRRFVSQEGMKVENPAYFMSKAADALIRKYPHRFWGVASLIVVPEKEGKHSAENYEMSPHGSPVVFTTDLSNSLVAFKNIVFSKRMAFDSPSPRKGCHSLLSYCCHCRSSAL
jgi:hypothetical protein